MPNTKSAERRVRNSARKQVNNQSTVSRLKTLETKYKGLLTSNKKEDAAAALKSVTSAIDKAVKTGVLHRSTADRKKSRLTISLNKLK